MFNDTRFSSLTEPGTHAHTTHGVFTSTTNFTDACGNIISSTTW